MAFQTMVGKLMADGHQPAMIASALMQLCFARDDESLQDITFDRKSADGTPYRKLILSIGRKDNVAPNHIVSAIAGRANIRGGEIGRIEIYDERSLVGIPAEKAEAVETAMQGATICGIPVRAKLSAERAAAQPARGQRMARRDGHAARRDDRLIPRRDDNSDEKPRISFLIPPEDAATPMRSPHKIKLSAEARARLLDAADLSRFEIGAGARERRQSSEFRRNTERRPYGERKRFDRNAPKPADRRNTRKNETRAPKRKHPR